MRSSIVSGSTCIASQSNIFRLTVTLDVEAIITDFTRSSEIVGDIGSWTRTDDAVIRISSRSVSIVSRVTEFTVIAMSIVLAVQTLSGLDITLFRMSVALTGNTRSEVSS
jgi:hypothetical protein